jgi:glycosyltransferase involved in cell wall biosynthesis
VKIICPMPVGNGAFIAHQLLAERIPGYAMRPYHPAWTMLPFLLPLIGDREADILHTVPDYALFFHRRGMPMVLTFQNYVLDKAMRHYSSALQYCHYQTDLKWFTRLALRRASVVTAVSRYTAELVRRDLGYDGEIRCIYNGVDTGRFHPGKQRPQSRGPIKVLFCGNLSRRKGAHLLPDIARRLQSDIQILYTRGLRAHSPLPALPNLIDLGMIRHADMPELMRSVHLLLFPTFREGFGLVAAEAMATGLPVIATNCSSLPELVEDGRGGYLCAPGDVAAFADRISQLAENPGLRNEMGEYNRARAERLFSLDRIVRQYQALFEEIKS